MKRYQLNSTKYLSDIEQNALLKLLDGSRDALMIRLALCTGGRASEILGLSRADIDTAQKSVMIRGIKGSNDREIPLSKTNFAHLSVYLKTLTTERLFPLSHDTFQNAWYWFRPCKKKLHSLRHTFAINLYRKTRDIRLVQVALGHKSINNTMIYAEYLYSSEELRKAIL